MFKKSWKTTSTGMLTVVGGAVGLYFTIKSGNVTPEALTAELGAIVTGLGLIFAKDVDVTGGAETA